MNRPPFAGPVTFLGGKSGPIPGARFSIIGVPWDGAVSNRPGQRFGPRNIRLASTMLTQEEHPRFETAPITDLEDLGDVQLPQGTEDAHSVLENVMTALLDTEPIILGGDHSITLPILRRVQRRYDQIALIHLDAHHDNWDSVFGERVSHGTWLNLALEEKLVEPNLVFQLGVRSPSKPGSNKDLANSGGHVWTARELYRQHPAQIAQVIRNQIGDIPCWLSLDIDVLDPAFAPAVGTPEVGGLSTAWLLEFMEELVGIDFIGMDLVEVSDPDPTQITALAAATLVWTYMAMRMTY